MLKWLPFPLIRISGVFMLGAYCGLETDILWPLAEHLWIILTGVFFWLTLKLKKGAFRKWNPYVCAIGLLLIFLAGVLRSHWSIYQRDLLINATEYYQAKVIETNILSNHTSTVILQMQWIKSPTGIHLVNDRIQWSQSQQTVDGNSDQQEIHRLNYGDQVIIKGTPTIIKKPANPKEFDYANYLSRKNIFWQHWVKGPEIAHINPNQEISLNRFAWVSKRCLQQLIVQHLKPGATQEITGAMLLGNRQGVSDILEDSFIKSGTIHILAVSGLHLGILYWLVVQLFGSWRSHRLLKWAFLIIGLSVIWGFSLLTGLAASTQRAGIMCSIFLLGNVLNRQSNTVNSLGGAAILIILVDPYQLLQVGFQLSFIALAGILFLQPKIACWWKPAKGITRYFWELASVSLAAQIAVLPISVYYFHQFPTYFLLANLLLLPLAFGIIVAGIGFFISTIVPSLIVLFTVPLTVLTKVAGFIVKQIGSLPGSTLQGLEIDIFEMILFYAALCCLFLIFDSYNKWLLVSLLFLLTVVAGIECEKKMIVNKNQLIAVYHISGHTALDFIDRSTVRTVMDVALKSDLSKVEYKMGGFRRHLGTNMEIFDANPATATDTFKSWIFKRKRVVLVTAEPSYRINGNIKLKSHIVIVSNNSVRSIDVLNNWITFDLLLIDGSNDPWIARALEEEAEKHGLIVHNSWTQGAKIINL